MTRKIYELTQDDLDSKRDVSGVFNPNSTVFYAEERAANVVEPGDFSVIHPTHTGRWVRVASTQYNTTTVTFDSALPLFSEFIFENTGEGTLAFVSGTVLGSAPVEDKFNIVMSSLSAPTVTGVHRVILAKVMSEDTILLTGALDDL